MRSSIPEFASIEAAQKWLDANGGRAHLNGSSLTHGPIIANCYRDCLWASRGLAQGGDHSWTHLKMAARRLSNALAYHYPRMFG